MSNCFFIHQYFQFIASIFSLALLQRINLTYIYSIFTIKYWSTYYYFSIQFLFFLWERQKLCILWKVERKWDWKKYRLTSTLTNYLLRFNNGLLKGRNKLFDYRRLLISNMHLSAVKKGKRVLYTGYFYHAYHISPIMAHTIYCCILCIIHVVGLWPMPWQYGLFLHFVGNLTI